MVWIRILVVTPLVLVMAVLLLSFLALQAVFAGEGRTRPAYAGDGDYSLRSLGLGRRRAPESGRSNTAPAVVTPE
jgi:hypothetical protein